MSIQCGVTCLDCNASAPGVGDGGYFGAPTLDPAPGAYAYAPQMPAFGFLYEPLMGLGLRTYEMDAFLAFLEQHRGHLVYLHSDHDDPDLYPPEIRAKAAAFEDSEHFSEEERRHEAQKQEAMRSGRYVEAYYALDCQRCRATYATTESDRFRATTAAPISNKTVRLFLERWGELTPDDGWNHRLAGPLDPWSPFLERLPDFVKLHEGHPLVARLSQEPIASTHAGDDLKQLLARHRAQRAERRQKIAWLWPLPAAGLGYGAYLSRVLLGWLLLEALPLTVFAATRPSITTASRVALMSAIVAAPSLLWTLMGARFAWQRLAKSYRQTLGNGAQNAVRGLALSWAAWAVISTLGGRILVLPLTFVAPTMEWLHLWLLPSTVILGVIAGHVQWQRRR